MLEIFKQNFFIKITSVVLGTFFLFFFSLSSKTGFFFIFLTPLPLMVLRIFEEKLIVWQAFIAVGAGAFLFAPLSAFIMFLLLFLVPTGLFIKCLTNNLSDDLGRIISSLVGYFICLIVLFLGILEMIGVDFLSAIKESFLSLVTIFGANNFEHILQKIAPFFPSMFCAWHLGTFALNIGIALGVKNCFQKTSLKPLSLRTAVFHRHWDIIFVLGLLLQLTGSNFFVLIGENISCMSCIPMFTLGLQILRFWLKEISKWWFWAFIVLCFMFIWVGLAVVIIGFLNATSNLRKKLI